jgi:hypothetical protein
LCRKILFFLVLLSALNLAANSKPDNGLDGLVNPPEIIFGEKITFQVELDQPETINNAFLFVQPDGQEPEIFPFPPSAQAESTIEYDLSSNPLRPFVWVSYWYQIETLDGQSITSPKQRFRYEDSRFEWQRLETPNFEIAWTNGDASVGQQALEVASHSQRSVRSLLDVDLPTPVSIFIYSSALDLQSALNLSQSNWIAGHASPDIGVILISIPPGPDQRAEMERQIPHELMHIAQYQVVGDDYSRLPLWLSEGMASNAELYPNPEYQRVLQNAINSDTLLPMVNLCAAFPRELSGAILAYAQSSSFVRFLIQNYGLSSLRDLITAYQDGLGCEEGVRSVMNQTIAQLETRWHQEVLGRDLTGAAWRNLRPYFFILILILIPAGLTLLPRRKQRGQNAIQ